MQLDQQIRINELLLQREDLFLRIHSAETEIVHLLGGPFPFTRPTLPSDRRSKRKPGSTSATTAARASAPDKKTSAAEPLRRLADDEAAYRVTYLQFNREVVETHPDSTAIATLLAAQAAHLRVLKIETLDAADAPRAILVETPPSS